jgi:hypothetical protein
MFHAAREVCSASCTSHGQWKEAAYEKSQTQLWALCGRRPRVAKNSLKSAEPYFHLVSGGLKDC